MRVLIVFGGREHTLLESRRSLVTRLYCARVNPEWPNSASVQISATDIQVCFNSQGTKIEGDHRPRSPLDSRDPVYRRQASRHSPELGRGTIEGSKVFSKGFSPSMASPAEGTAFLQSQDAKA